MLLLAHVWVQNVIFELPWKKKKIRFWKLETPRGRFWIGFTPSWRMVGVAETWYGLTSHWHVKYVCAFARRSVFRIAYMIGRLLGFPPFQKFRCGRLHANASVSVCQQTVRAIPEWVPERGFSQPWCHRTSTLPSTYGHGRFHPDHCTAPIRHASWLKNSQHVTYKCVLVLVCTSECYVQVHAVTDRSGNHPPTHRGGGGGASPAVRFRSQQKGL